MMWNKGFLGRRPAVARLWEASVSEEVSAKMARTIIDGEVEEATELANQGLAQGFSAADIQDKGFVKGMEEVGHLFGKGEFFLPELVKGPRP